MTSTLLSRQGRRPHLTDRKGSPCFLLHFCDESKGVSLFSSFTSTALHPPSGENLIRSFIPRVIGGLLGGRPSCCGQSRMKCPVSLQILQVGQPWSSQPLLGFILSPGSAFRIAFRRRINSSMVSFTSFRASSRSSCCRVQSVRVSSRTVPIRPPSWSLFSSGVRLVASSRTVPIRPPSRSLFSSGVRLVASSRSLVGLSACSPRNGTGFSLVKSIVIFRNWAMKSVPRSRLMSNPGIFITYGEPLASKPLAQCSGWILMWW